MVKLSAAKSVPFGAHEWLRLVYAGETAGGNNLAKPLLAAQWLKDDPALLGTDPYLACAAGDIARLVAALGSGELADYQMAAWLMAVYFRGLDDEEITVRIAPDQLARLALALAQDSILEG